jgi:hypothetical protein
VVAKSRPHREQKKLASPLLARLYTSVGPVTGVGGNSRKIDPFKDCTLAGLSSQKIHKQEKVGPKGPYSFIISLKNVIVRAKTKVMQIAARYDTLESR